MKSIEEFYYWEMTTRDTIDVKKMYIDISDDLVAGILLSQIIFWNLPNQEGHTKLRVWKENELWLAKRRDDWHEEIRISAKQYDRAIKILSDLDLVTVKIFKFDGVPTPHIKLNTEILMQAINQMVDKNKPSKATDSSILPKGKNGLSPKVEKEITETSKTNLPKGENANSPKVDIQIDEKEKSLTENTTKTTTENTTDIVFIWTRAKEKMREEMKDVTYQTWIEPLIAKEIINNDFILVAESQFNINILNSRFKGLIQNVISVITNKDYEVIFKL